MKNHLQRFPNYSVSTRRELHTYATQRARRSGGSGMASVDIHAWVLTLVLAFLLRHDLIALAIS